MAEARAFAEELAEGLQDQVDLTVGGVVERYLQWLTLNGNKQRSLTNARDELRRLCGPLCDREIVRIQLPTARAAYLRHVEDGAAAATHQMDLRRARAMWKWALQEGLVKMNPWLLVRPLGKPRKGKEQLTTDESALLIAVCEQHLFVDDRAVAVLLALLCGLRSSEVCDRVVRDVDQGGRALRVKDAKTPAGERQPRIPKLLQRALLTRCAGRRPTDWLLLTPKRCKPGNKWLALSLAKYCKLAGVPVVCPHALRGQYATVLFEDGVDPDRIARAMGHRSRKVTEAHYAKPGAPQRGREKRRERALRLVK